MVCNPKPMPTDKAETKIAKCVIGRPIHRQAHQNTDRQYAPMNEAANIERDSGRTELWREPNFLMLSFAKLAEPVGNKKNEAEFENIERIDLTAASCK